MLSWKKAGGLALDVLFPRRCPWCNAVLGFSGPCACEERAQKLLRQPTSVDMEKERLNCLFLDEVFALYLYEDPVKQAVWNMKFPGSIPAGEALGTIMAQNAARIKIIADCIIPVPVSEATLADRGFNQSELLARPVAGAYGLPLYTDVLFKVFETERQMDLGRQQRRGNVLGAYAAENSSKVAGKRVLLVDDVVTTGSTLNECAKMLRAAGAKSCKVYTLACAAKRSKDENQTL